MDFASEFRYRHVALVPGNPAIFVSQSGETADTLASLEFAKTQGHRVLSVVNVAGSIMERAAIVLPILAGPEVGRRQLKRSPVNWRRLLALLSRMDEIGTCFRLTTRFRWCRRWWMFPAI
jgi:glucosamine 6-phosphate synthetase-like amidotransferase/phosphosugar isomerase protein